MLKGALGPVVETDIAPVSDDAASYPPRAAALGVRREASSRTLPTLPGGSGAWKRRLARSATGRYANIAALDPGAVGSAQSSRKARRRARSAPRSPIWHSQIVSTSQPMPRRRIPCSASRARFRDSLRVQ